MNFRLTVESYFKFKTSVLENCYSDLDLTSSYFDKIDSSIIIVPRFDLNAEVFTDFLYTWSALNNYLSENGIEKFDKEKDPVQIFRKAIRNCYKEHFG